MKDNDWLISVFVGVVLSVVVLSFVITRMLGG